MRFLLRSLLGRFGPLGVAVGVYELWRLLPGSARKWLVGHGRRQGLRIATRARGFVAATIDR